MSRKRPARKYSDIRGGSDFHHSSYPSGAPGGSENTWNWVPKKKNSGGKWHSGIMTPGKLKSTT